MWETQMRSLAPDCTLAAVVVGVYPWVEECFLPNKQASKQAEKMDFFFFFKIPAILVEAFLNCVLLLVCEWC